MNITSQGIASLTPKQRASMTPNLVPRLTPIDLIMRAQEDEETFIREATRVLEDQDRELREERRRLWKGIALGSLFGACIWVLLFWLTGGKL